MVVSKFEILPDFIRLKVLHLYSRLSFAMKFILIQNDLEGSRADRGTGLSNMQVMKPQTLRDIVCGT